MPLYLLWILGWIVAAVAVTLLMGRFIAAGKGELGTKREFTAPAQRRGERRQERAVARPGKREAA